MATKRAKAASEKEATETGFTMPPEQAFKELNCGRNQGYAAIKAGLIPHIRVGKSIKVLTVPFRRMLRGEDKAPGTKVA